jgi:ribosomal protein S18 acetylase RimI-like enzyme
MGRPAPCSNAAVIVHPVQPEQAEAAGQVVVAAFEAVPGAHMNGGYGAELADVAARAEVSEVLVAVDQGRVIGCVTFVPDGASPLAEQLGDGECQIRMMAVDPAYQGRGIGQVLLDAALDRARALGREAVFLHSTPEMAAAHRLYLGNGFVRVPERDWRPEPDLLLIAFHLDLAAS